MLNINVNKIFSVPGLGSWFSGLIKDSKPGIISPIGMFVACFLVLNSFGLGIGTQFLVIPASASELALGSQPVFGYTSTGNPALLKATGPGPRLRLSYGSWLAGVKALNLGVEWPWRGFTGGLRIRYAGLDDLELRSEIPTAEPLAHFGAYGFALDGLISKRVGRTWGGLAVRSVYMELYTKSTAGVAMDVGFIRAQTDRLNFAVSILNLGFMSALENESPRLPLRILSGAAVRFPMDRLTHTFLISGEWNSQVTGVIMRVASDLKWKQLGFQLGAQVSEKVTVVSTGFGLELGIYQIQYGLRLASRDLGLPQLLDISVKLP